MTQLIAFFVSLGSRFFFVFGTLIAYVTAKRVAISVTYIVAAGAIFATMAGLVKVAVMGLRVSIPGSLASGTFLLPASINSFIAALITIRLTYFLWTWTHNNLRSFVNAQNSSPL